MKELTYFSVYGHLMMLVAMETVQSEQVALRWRFHCESTGLWQYFSPASREQFSYCGVYCSRCLGFGTNIISKMLILQIDLFVCSVRPSLTCCKGKISMLCLCNLCCPLEVLSVMTSSANDLCFPGYHVIWIPIHRKAQRILHFFRFLTVRVLWPFFTFKVWCLIPSLFCAILRQNAVIKTIIST